MEVAAHEVDIFHVNLPLQNVPDLTQADLNFITELWLRDLDDAVPRPDRANNAVPPTPTTNGPSTWGKYIASFFARRSAINPPRETRVAHCIICDEDVTSFVQVPCEDVYCIACLCRLFELATNDESLMPPRCCHTVIPLDLVASHLSAPLRIKFERKLEEHNTPNRIYCSRPSCAAFIGSADGPRRMVQCPVCYAGVCTSCKKATHQGACKKDKETRKAVKFCRRKGWQRCPGCQEMVELADGCYHMTCVCQTHFCYLCGARWDTCGCRCLFISIINDACRAVRDLILPARVVNQPLRRAEPPRLVNGVQAAPGLLVVPNAIPPAQNNQRVRAGRVNVAPPVGVRDQTQRPLVVPNLIRPAQNNENNQPIREAVRVTPAAYEPLAVQNPIRPTPETRWYVKWRLFCWKRSRPMSV